MNVYNQCLAFTVLNDGYETVDLPQIIQEDIAALLFGSVPFARNMYYLLNLLSNFTPNNSNMLKPLNGNLFSCKN